MLRTTNPPGFRSLDAIKGLQPPLRVRSAFRSRLRALGRLAVPPGRYVVGAAPTVGARSRTTAAPSFTGPLRQPGAGITTGTDESRSHPSSPFAWRLVAHVDLDLVEPAGVYRQVDEDEVRPAPLEAVDGFLAAVRGAVVDDQKTRRAEAYGSLVITCQTSRSKASIPPLGSERPKTRGRLPPRRPMSSAAR